MRLDAVALTNIERVGRLLILVRHEEGVRFAMNLALNELLLGQDVEGVRVEVQLALGQRSPEPLSRDREPDVLGLEKSIVEAQLAARKSLEPAQIKGRDALQDDKVWAPQPAAEGPDEDRHVLFAQPPKAAALMRPANTRRRDLLNPHVVLA